MERIYRALEERGYHPVSQLTGYLLSEDPSYITNYDGARTLMLSMDREEILEELLEVYFNTWQYGTRS